MSQPAASRMPACAICGKPAGERFRPFCSARCADIDLGRWFGEAYRVPSDADDDAPPRDAEQA